MATFPADLFLQRRGTLTSGARPEVYRVDSKEFREEVLAAWPYFGPRQRALFYSMLAQLMEHDPAIGELINELDGMDVVDRLLDRRDELEFVPWDQALAELDTPAP